MSKNYIKLHLDYIDSIRIYRIILNKFKLYLVALIMLSIQLFINIIKVFI